MVPGGDGRNAGRLLAGRYRVIRELGRGGMGTVCQALDEVLGREVAVKEPRTFTDTGGPELRLLCGRMQREARAAARIRHTGVVAVHDVTEHEGRPIIVMELVDGPSLADLLRTEGNLDPYRAAAVGAEVADALAAAHRAGVLHRDVKPGNILLDRNGRVVLSDFGIATVDEGGDASAARMTQSGVLLGSLEYMAPERAQGHRPGPPSDVWSLGATLYAAVEGTSPFQRSATWPTLTAIISEPMPDPRHAGPLTAVLRQLMDKDPEARPDAEQARDLLRAVASAREETPGGPVALVTPPAAVRPASGAVAAPAGDGPEPRPGPPVPDPLPGPSAPPPAAAPRHPPGQARAARRRRVVVAVTAVGVVLAVAATVLALVGGGTGQAPTAAHGRKPAVPAARSVPVGAGTAGPAASARKTAGQVAPAGAGGAAEPGATPTGAAREGGTAGAQPGASPDSAPVTGAGAGAGASPTTTRPASTAPAPACTAAGDGTYTCTLVHGAKSYDDAGTKVGRVGKGAHPFFCQSDQGRRVTRGAVTSLWWARTDDDKGNSGVWISVVFIQGSASDQPLTGLPTC